MYTSRNYKPPSGEDSDQFFAKLTPGTAVAEQPGQTWQHTGQGWEWQAPGAGGAKPESPPPGTTQGGIRPPSAVPVGPSTQDPMRDMVRQRLMGLLNTDPTQASVRDADLAPQAMAYRDARERSQQQQWENELTRLNGAGVGSSGAADAIRAKGAETAGRDIAGFEAGLVGDKLAGRQRQLEDALKMGGGMIMQEEGQNLTRQMANLDNSAKVYLANLDADLRRQGFSTSERLAAMDNELRRYGIDVQGNLGLLNAMLNMQQMGQQNTQFYDSLGWDMGRFGALLNQGLIDNMLR